MRQRHPNKRHPETNIPQYQTLRHRSMHDEVVKARVKTPGTTAEHRSVCIRHRARKKEPCDDEPSSLQYLHAKMGGEKNNNAAEVQYLMLE